MRDSSLSARSALISLVLAGALPSAHAVDVTLNFSGNICGIAGNAPCANSSNIGQSYGDIAGVVDVSYRSAVTGTGVTYEDFLHYWDAGYSNLTGVAWGGANQTGFYSEITFRPLSAGQQVTLNGFDFGDYLDSNGGSSVSIYALNGSLLWNGGSFNPGATAATHFAPAISSATGLILRWGPDGYNVGIDNIQFTVAGSTAPVPEPETWGLMLAGLTATGWYARRRRV
jgi:hypothetical protein